MTSLSDLEAEARQKNRDAAKARRAVKVARKRERPERVEHRRVVPVAKGQRAPRVRDNIYLQWLRRRACVACGSRKRVHAAHIRSGYPEAGWRPTGMQEKPDDARAAPLCATCHVDGPDAQHKSNERKWWEARNIYPPTLCANLRAAFEAETTP
jgi:hypothetical protein